MKKFTNFFFKKPTLFSILGSIILLTGIPFGIYGITQKGMEGIGGAYILTGVAIAAVILLIDRFLVKTVKLKWLNVAESIILLTAIIIYQYGNRKLNIEVNPTADYFILIENNGLFQNSPLDYKFPFSKNILANDRSAIINSINKNQRLLHLNSPENWNGYVMKSKNIKNTDVRFYANPEIDYKDETIDSLILIEINSLANR